MKRYKVDVVANDGAVAEFIVDSETDDGAVTKVFDSLSQEQKDKYEYKLKQLERLC